MEDREESLEIKPLSPVDFAMQMKGIEDTNGDEEQLHIAMDELMCNLLDSLGYKDGVAIFRRAYKWYA